jgi:hypothetical protein
MATYRYGVVRSRIAASHLVAGAGKRFESARRLSQFRLSKPNDRNKRGSPFILTSLLTPLMKARGGWSATREAA